MEDIVIRHYKKRTEMTHAELVEHKAKLMRVSNRKRYIKRIIKERDDAIKEGYKADYIELVDTITTLNDNGYTIKKSLIEELVLLEEELNYEPTFDFA